MITKYATKSRLLSFLILALIGCMLMTLPAMAEGAGDGSGGGRNIPLGLDSSTPADGQKDVALTGDIHLTFNKNVIYLLIRESNKKCFSLVAADGSKVPIEVIMADDQTPEGFEKRRDISLHPLQKLQPGTAYTVKISPTLQAKNGTSLGHEATVSFVTAGTASKAAEPAPAPAPGPVENTPPGESNPTPVPTQDLTATTPAADSKSIQSTGEKAPVVDENSKPLPKETDAQSKQTQQQDSKTIYLVIGGLLLAAGAGYIYIKIKK